MICRSCQACTWLALKRNPTSARMSPWEVEGDAISPSRMSYMTNTMFTELVANGFLGTTGGATKILRKQLDASLDGLGSVVFGVLDDRSGRRPGWGEPAYQVS